MVLGLIIGTALAAVRQVTPSHTAQADTAPCYRSSTLRQLSTLPSGLVASDIDLGPFIVATTSHRVVAATYHRLDKGILANEVILTSAHLKPCRACVRLVSTT
jgi:hypothetical protein